MISQELARKAQRLIAELGATEAARQFGVSRETVRRYARKHRQEKEQSGPSIESKVMRQLAERYSGDELRAMVTGSYCAVAKKSPRVNFNGDVITIGIIADTHIGSKFTSTTHIDQAREVFEGEGVDLVCHCGDVFEGLSHRPGHVYECTHLGYAAQLKEGVRIFSEWDFAPMYFIDGNHDRWYLKSSGALIVEELCRRLPNAEYLGNDEGDIDANGVTIRLWHGEDGSSYAASYRIQKIIESFTGGEKPNVLLCGHAHKSIYIFDRHIHAIGAGSMQSQSRWMRSKRLASHTGFWTVRMTINEGGVATFAPTFYPLYV